MKANVPDAAREPLFAHPLAPNMPAKSQKPHRPRWQHVDGAAGGKPGRVANRIR